MINGNLANGMANGHAEFEGVSLEELPKSHVYTSKLPRTPFPSPLSTLPY